MSKNQKTVTTVTTAPAASAGSILKNWRESMGYERKDACEALDCTRGDWALWEEGKQPVPRYVRLALSALAMGMVPYGDLDTGKSE